MARPQVLSSVLVSLLWVVPLFAAGPDKPTANTYHGRLYVRVARDAVLQGQAKSFERSQAVNDVILGAQVRGTSRTTGQYVVNPSSSGVKPGFVVDVNGTSIADTIGTKGPATIGSTATTRFHAHTLITFDPERGFVANDVQVSAQTIVQTNSIQARRGGLIGRVVRNGAQRQVVSTRPAMTEISRQKAIARISRAVAARVDERVARMNESVARLKTLVATLDPDLTQVSFVGMTDDSIILAVAPVAQGKAVQLMLADLPPLSAACEVWAHQETMPARVREKITVLVKARETARSLWDATRQFTALTGSAEVSVTEKALLVQHGPWIFLRITSLDAGKSGTLPALSAAQ